MQRVLALVILLDRAKAAKVLSGDPCLFLPLHAVKSPRHGAEFSRIPIGVGDLNKHLGLLGVTLSHKQTTLHEFNLASPPPTCATASASASSSTSPPP